MNDVNKFDVEKVKKNLHTMVEFELNEELDERTKFILDSFVNRAGGVLLNKVYPFHYDKNLEDVPKRFEQWCLDASYAIYSSMGYHNVRQYAENGLSVTLQAMDNGIPKTMLDQIVPNAKGL